MNTRPLMGLVVILALGASAKTSSREHIVFTAASHAVLRECFVDNESYSVYLLLDLRITNKSPGTICVPKDPPIVRLTVAQKAIDLEAGKYEVDLRPEPVISGFVIDGSNEPGGDAHTCTELGTNREVRLQETSPPLLVKLRGSAPRGLISAGEHVMAVEIGGIRADARRSQTPAEVGETLKIRSSNVIAFFISQREKLPSTCHH